MTTSADELNAALEAAATAGHAESARVLFDAGAGQDARRAWALILSAMSGDLAAVQQHIWEGADVRALDQKPLWCAAICGHAPIVDLLLSQPGMEFRQGRYGVLYAAALGNHLAVVELMLGRGALRKDVVFPALEGACRKGHLNIVRRLLEVSM